MFRLKVGWYDYKNSAVGGFALSGSLVFANTAASGGSSVVVGHIKLTFDDSACSVSSVSTEIQALNEATAILGGRERVADLFSIHENAVYQWFMRGIPANRVLTLVDAVDHQVSAKELRPDVFTLPARRMP
jgi:DNA-binding transcriptional regulator YdaS (Cro superfamily)